MQLLQFSRSHWISKVLLLGVMQKSIGLTLGYIISNKPTASFWPLEPPNQPSKAWSIISTKLKTLLIHTVDSRNPAAKLITLFTRSFLSSRHFWTINSNSHLPVWWLGNVRISIHINQLSWRRSSNSPLWMTSCPVFPIDFPLVSDWWVFPVFPIDFPLVSSISVYPVFPIGFPLVSSISVYPVFPIDFPLVSSISVYPVFPINGFPLVSSISVYPVFPIGFPLVSSISVYPVFPIGFPLVSSISVYPVFPIGFPLVSSISVYPVFPIGFPFDSCNFWTSYSYQRHDSSHRRYYWCPSAGWGPSCW